MSGWTVVFNDPEEPLSGRIWKHLLSIRKFPEWGIAAPATFSGREQNPPVGNYEIGLLGKEILDPNARIPRREFIGTIHWHGDGANELIWIFYVYGRKYIKLVEQIAEELASAFDVGIIIRLENESKVETFFEEYDK